jgi:type IV pilus assembly protein PilV
MKNEKGFSLIEVMIAMVIFAIGIMAVMQMHLWTTKNNSNSNFISIATMAATQKVEELRGTNLVAGEYNEKNGLVSVQYVITEDPVNPRLDKVVVNASLRGKTVNLETYNRRKL